MGRNNYKLAPSLPKKRKENERKKEEKKKEKKRKKVLLICRRFSYNHFPVTKEKRSKLSSSPGSFSLIIPIFIKIIQQQMACRLKSKTYKIQTREWRQRIRQSVPISPQEYIKLMRHETQIDK